MKWSTKIFFYLRAISSSLGSNFSKTTENETIKMTDTKIVKVDKHSPYTFSFKTSYSQENYKKVVVNNRRKTNSAAAQLVLQPAYCKNLPTVDKKEADILDLLGKKSHSQIVCYFLWVLISIIIITFKALFFIFVFCFFLNYDNNVIINLKALCVLYVGQAFCYSPQNAFYIFNQQIYFIIRYLLDRASLI